MYKSNKGYWALWTAVRKKFWHGSNDVKALKIASYILDKNKQLG